MDNKLETNYSESKIFPPALRNACGFLNKTSAQVNKPGVANWLCLSSRKEKNAKKKSEFAIRNDIQKTPIDVNKQWLMWSTKNSSTWALMDDSQSENKLLKWKNRQREKANFVSEKKILIF